MLLLVLCCWSAALSISEISLFPALLLRSTTLSSYWSLNKIIIQQRISHHILSTIHCHHTNHFITSCQQRVVLPPLLVDFLPQPYNTYNALDYGKNKYVGWSGPVIFPAWSLDFLVLLRWVLTLSWLWGLKKTQPPFFFMKFNVSCVLLPPKGDWKKQRFRLMVFCVSFVLVFSNWRCFGGVLVVF